MNLRHAATTAAALAVICAAAPGECGEGPLGIVFFGVRGVHEDPQVPKDVAKIVEIAAEDRKVTLFTDEDVRREMDSREAWRSVLRDALAALKEAQEKYLELDLDAALLRVERAEKLLGAACGDALYRKHYFDALSLHGLVLWQKGDRAKAVERFKQAVIAAPDARPPAGLFTPDIELGMEEARIVALGSQKPAAAYDQLCDCTWQYGSAFALLGHVVASSKGKGVQLMLYGAERGDLLASRSAPLEGPLDDVRAGIAGAAAALFAAADDARETKKYTGRTTGTTAPRGAPPPSRQIIPSFSQNPWAWSLAGTAVLFTSTGVTFTVLTKKAESDYETLIATSRNAPPDPKALETVKSAGETRALVATVSYVIAGAAAAGAVYLFIWPIGGRSASASSDAAPHAPVTIVPLPGGAAVNYGCNW